MANRSAAELVARRILDELDDLAFRMGAAYRAEVAEYAALSDDEMRTEVLPVSREIVEVFFRAVADSRRPDVDDVPALARMGRRRLEMGVPLEPMLHVYRVAGRTVWDAVVAATDPGEERVLADLGAAWMDYIDRASSVAASSYLEASHERLRRIDAHRGALLEALLGAADPSDVAAVAVEFATSFAGRYVPVLVAGEGASSRIDTLTTACGDGTIGGFRGNHVVCLVPDQLPDLRALSVPGDGSVVAHGNPAPPGPALAAELGHTDALLQVAVATGRDGVVGPGDLLLDQLLVAAPRVGQILQRTVLAPLRDADRGGLIVATLRSYLRTGSVPTTAQAELVHPNTVAYRLRRITDLTGLDPRVPEQAALLTLALRVAAPPPP